MSITLLPIRIVLTDVLATMSSPTFGCIDLPIVIRWGQSEPFSYIGTPAQQLRMNVDLGTEDKPKLLFWFSATVGVTVGPESVTIRKKPLYFVLQASLFGKAGGITLAESPYKVSSNTRTAMQKSGIYIDGTTVSRIYFKLENNGTVFMPPIEKHPFTPASSNVVQLLADLQSLSQAKNFCVYTSGQTSTITQLWERIPHINRGTFTGDFTTQNVYKSNMVCDMWTNFNQFARQGHPAKCRLSPQDPQGDPAIDLITSDSANILTKRVVYHLPLFSTKILWTPITMENFSQGGSANMARYPPTLHHWISLGLVSTSFYT